MEEFTFSKITLTYGLEDAYKIIVEFMIDENSDDSGELLLQFEATKIGQSGRKSENICVEYFSETQILELYFFLKANLAAKHGHIL